MALPVHTNDLPNTDGASAITYRRKSDAGDTTYSSITHALRGSVGKRDAEILSGLAHNDQATVWHFPASELAVAAQQDDRIEVGVDKWIIVVAELMALSSRWRCLCVKEVV